MDEETYKAKSNGLTPEENEQIQKSEDERSTENNANNLRNAANVAMQTKIPHAVAAGAIVKGADKLTGGKSSEAAGKIITKINKRIPMGKQIQETSNELNESGISDAIGAATSIDKTEQVQKASSAASAASNAANSKKDGNFSPFSKNKIKNKYLIISIASSCIFFFFIPILLILIGPNAGAMLDLTSKGGDVGYNNTNYNASAYTAAEAENLLIYMGDSRIVGMMSSITNKSITYIAQSGAGYSWLVDSAIPELANKIEGKKFIVLAFGVNDLGNAANYLTKYQELKDTYPNVKIYIMSVNPVDEAKEAENGYTVTNESIENFNETMKNSFGENYIDVYAQIKDNFETEDGVHYTTETYKKIHEIVINYILSKNKIAGATSDYGYPANTESTELKGTSLVEAIGEDGVTELENKIKTAVGSGCSGASVARAAIALIDGLHAKGFHLPYYYGGGHVSKNSIVDRQWGANIGASTQKPNGSYDYYKGLDCSGFVMWAMHAANITGAYDASGYLSLGEHIPFSKLSPGDVIANTGHVILVLENTGSELKTAESTGGGVQYKTYGYDKASYYTGISMSEYYANHCGG
ncbi:MAG: C40 family peptidase [Bacilli bacterium]|nr:C40 family peptidase [Bacilli bacterium]